MRYLFIFALIVNYCSSSPQVDKIQFADNQVIAHRGAWKAEGLPQNSIAALKHAIALKCAGSEFDVRMTSDDVLIVTHDHDFHGLVIEESTYKELANFKLSNGEILPTLRAFLKAGMTENTSTGLVCEIKPSQKEDRNIKIVDHVVDLVKELKAEPFISSYISFSYDMVKRIEERDPSAVTMYLDGSLPPERLYADGIDGLDYHMNKFKYTPDWITEAKAYDLILNAWTVNKAEDIDWLLANDFDFITTDEPELVFERIAQSPTAKDWKMVWSDEFNYTGKPDSSKWDHEIGFIRNQEKQYYTDRRKNSRVENGVLILETHKERVENAAFEGAKVKNWRQNQPHGQYSAASLETKDLAEWKYCRIDIRAKLPKGRGMWPAFWMLGENLDEIGWPECGEIDIMEHVGFEADSIYGTIHSQSYNHMNGTEKGRSIFIEKPYDDFHDYTLIWTAEYMDFILDGEVYNHIKNEHKTTHEWPFDQNFHLKLNVAVGGMWGGQKGIDDTVFPNEMIIDYVRVYQKDI